ncbi:MAG: YggS family pyridoxal phosphate-dependent enzyme [bacterium]
MQSIAKNIQELKEKITSAAKKAGRDPEDILLLAVSKTVPTDRVKLAREAGQIDFGENRVQEAREKIPKLSEDITWHLVGHLQRNKAKYCPALFDWIHSVDSVALAKELGKRYEERGKMCKTLVQVNVSGEESKFGCHPNLAEEVFTAILEENFLEAVGLMTMPPFSCDPEDSRPYFENLREIRDELTGRGYGQDNLNELSMGMSGDFEVAIEEGATIIRIGTAVFGERDG